MLADLDLDLIASFRLLHAWFLSGPQVMYKILNVKMGHRVGTEVVPVITPH